MFIVEATEEMTLTCPDSVAGMFTLSPFVWREGTEYLAMFRIVPDREIAAEKIARVHLATSADGLNFSVDPEPVIAPGPAADDIDGCEDPTVVKIDGRYIVYYTGWNEKQKVGRLLLADGPAPDRLTKRGVALASMQDQLNPKEATLVLAADGRWRLFYEYAADDASRIGVASGETADGPWRIEQPPFARREEQWDCWHLSTGPILEDAERPVMFYNGATRDAHWRIGWVAFSPDFQKVVDRGETPLIIPEIDAATDWTDIAFAASCVTVGDKVWLYYSVADRALMRATLRRT